ncbi:hypothetical protein Ddc_13404 [Ditylenchus destructor]|nr:hypothetical protein Ddc_13404 [Ditylenchus destructor]
MGGDLIKEAPKDIEKVGDCYYLSLIPNRGKCKARLREHEFARDVQQQREKRTEGNIPICLPNSKQAVSCWFFSLRTSQLAHASGKALTQ